MMLCEIILILSQQILWAFLKKRGQCQFFAVAYAYIPLKDTLLSLVSDVVSDVEVTKLSCGWHYNFWRMYKFLLIGSLSHPIFWIWPHCHTMPDYYHHIAMASWSDYGTQNMFKAFQDKQLINSCPAYVEPREIPKIKLIYARLWMHRP